MKIYKEKELINEIDGIVDLGNVEAGITKEFIYYVVNDEDSEIYDIVYTVEPLENETNEDYIKTASEIKITEAPTNLMPQEVGEIKIVWESSISIKRGVKAKLRGVGKELWS